jgi:hypothetical protein
MEEAKESLRHLVGKFSDLDEKNWNSILYCDFLNQFVVYEMNQLSFEVPSDADEFPL